MGRDFTKLEEEKNVDSFFKRHHLVRVAAGPNCKKANHDKVDAQEDPADDELSGLRIFTRGLASRRCGGSCGGSRGGGLRLSRGRVSACVRK